MTAQTASRSSDAHPPPIPKTVSFVVPALNEEKSIAGVVMQVREAVAAAALDGFEILLINDGSTDGTGTIMDGLAVEDDNINVIHNSKNLGLGGAYFAGVGAARCNYVIMIPGDNNHPAAGITPILEMTGDADIIIPYVINRGTRTPIRRFLSTGFVWSLNFLFGHNITYYNGIVMHRKDLLESAAVETAGFAYQAEAIIKLLRRGASYAEVGVVISGKDEKGSNAFRFRNVVAVVETVLRLLYNKLGWQDRRLKR